MNKYQKQAIVDIAKVAGAIVAVIAAFNIVNGMGVPAGDIVGTLSLVAMGYAIYQLYRIRVGQLESEDKLTEMEQKYK